MIDTSFQNAEAESRCFPGAIQTHSVEEKNTGHQRIIGLACLVVSLFQWKGG